MTTLLLDDNTEVQSVADISAVLREQAQVTRDVPPTMTLKSGDAELIVGVRGNRAVLYWMTYSDDDAVATGGTNPEPVSYGHQQILMPAYTEIALENAIEAAVVFARSGQRPESVTWALYVDEIERSVD
ncbi:hypothetical protein GCM10009676_18400 [Prauserella halophila]|uniref:Immunity protein Imm1 n=1 Tax=Prauserella halophila TaxID=185641 RepID=A0ABN1W6I1_9PSEU|nr:Imm1 family immunity protein [Prauserella halophila]MCP2235957.1 Immunity protein Imm1 [Prauserella halophila]